MSKRGDEEMSTGYEKDSPRTQKIAQLKKKVHAAFRRSTFHGIGIIIEMPPGMKRILMIMFVICGFLVATTGSIYLFISFYNFPYKTLINFESRSFEFPGVTFCPLSPFTDKKLKQAPKDVHQKYTNIVQFWTENGRLNEEQKQIQIKRSFTRVYYQYFQYLKREWYELFVSCYYNGHSCLGDIVQVEHPMMYLCYQVRLNQSYYGKPRSGLARGLELIMYRQGNDGSQDNYTFTTEDVPLLMTNEFHDQIVWHLNGGSNSSNGNRLWDGVMLVSHRRGSLPPQKLTAAETVYTTQFGRRLSLTLRQKYYKQTRTMHHPCLRQKYKKYSAQNWLSLERFYSMDQKADTGMANIGREGCVAALRQHLVLVRCQCLSELTAVPVELITKLRRFGFCHDIELGTNDFLAGNHGKNDSIRTREAMRKRSQCVNSVESLTDSEVLDASSSGANSRKLLCLPVCDRPISEVKMIYSDGVSGDGDKEWMDVRLLADLQQLLRRRHIKDSLLEMDVQRLRMADLIQVDIHAEEERVPVLDEDRDKNLGNFIAEVGGAYGLVVGLSGVSAYEILEVVILVTAILFYRYCRRQR